MIFLAKDTWPDTVTRDDGNLKNGTNLKKNGTLA